MKLTVIGGGGVRSLMLAKSIAHFSKELHISDIVFMDNNEQKLNIYGMLSKQAALRINPELNFLLTTDPIAAVTDADYVITTIRVGEDQKRIDDEKIALNHGILGQETTGAAGFSFAMRSVPALAKYCELIKKYSRPSVKVFNFTNPAGVVSQTLRDMGYDFTFGICDAPTDMLKSFARLYRVPMEDIAADCYGLNHLSFFSSVKFGGKEMLPQLIEDDRIYQETDMRFFSKDLTRTVGRLLNEYLYYYFYREEAIGNILKAGATRGEVIRDINRNMTAELLNMDPEKDFDRCIQTYVKWQGQRSALYMKNETGISKNAPFEFNIDDPDDGGYAGIALQYIRAEQTGKNQEMIFCVPNQGAISGLLDTDVVEISCTVSADGYRPHSIADPGIIPMEIIRRVKLYERYASQAIRNKDVEAAELCLMVHPLVNSYSLAQTLVKEYLESNKDYTDGWTKK